MPMNQQFIPRQIEMCTHMGQKTCIKVSRCLHIIEKIIQLYIHAIEYCPAKIRGEKNHKKTQQYEWISRNNVEWKKPVPQQYTLCDFIYRKFKNRQNKLMVFQDRTIILFHGVRVWKGVQGDIWAPGLVVSW